MSEDAAGAKGRQPANWTLTPMGESDLEEVLEIEATAHPTPWSRALFAGELVLEWSQLKVLRDGVGSLLGYIDYWLVHDELHVLNIAVGSWARRRGYAKVMLADAFSDGLGKGAEVVVLEVRVTNLGAQRLYESLGFHEIGRRRGYYSDTGEDALILALELTDWVKINAGA